MPITVTEYIGQAVDNGYDIQLSFINCPWCKRPQGFRFTPITYCSDCNRGIIDALKLICNIRYRVAYHRHIINDAGIQMDGTLGREFR